MVNNYYNKYIKYKIKYLNLGGMMYNNDEFIITLINGNTFNIDPSSKGFDIDYMHELIKKVAEHLDVYPFQITLLQGTEIISNDVDQYIHHIERDLICIIKSPTLYVYYKFVHEPGCSGGDGRGSIYVSLVEPNYDDCEDCEKILEIEPGMCLNYIKLQNTRDSCCGGFTRYTDFCIGLMDESNGVITYDNDFYGHDLEISQCILSYDDVARTLLQTANYEDQKVKEIIVKIRES